MSMSGRTLQAVQMLVIANACWALSFPTMKALQMMYRALLPQSNSWFVAASTISVRFALATVVMLLVCIPTLRRITRLEVWQGLGLGIFATAGLVLQMDGLAYTSASTSAFLTQFYCIIIPTWVAWRERRWPTGRTVLSCGLVIAGVMVLSDIDWHQLRLGRGELETLLGSIIFTGQILWLQRPKFAPNNVNHFTLVMFAVIMVVALPVAVCTAASSGDWLPPYRVSSVWILTTVLTVFCTLGAYLLMNYWQPFLSATQAGLLYCLEPVFASAFALFLPAWLSTMAGIQYPNELISWSLLIGGALITVANILMNLTPTPAPGQAAPSPLISDKQGGV
jgi:drug/metabolite transporter (DMT)-like permease